MPEGWQFTPEQVAEMRGEVDAGLGQEKARVPAARSRRRTESLLLARHEIEEALRAVDHSALLASVAAAQGHLGDVREKTEAMLRG